MNRETMPCKTCGKHAGGRCPKCEELICFECLISMELISRSGVREYRRRCRPCSTELVLTEEVVWMRCA